MNKIQTGPTTDSFYSLFRIVKHSFKIAGISMMFLIIFALTSCKDSSTDANAKIEIAAAVETLNNALVDPNEELLKDITLSSLHLISTAHSYEPITRDKIVSTFSNKEGFSNFIML